MILIADSGATKTQWGCVNRDGTGRHDFFSQGYNPNYKIDLEAYNEHKRELGLLYIDNRVDVPDLVYREDEISDAPYPGINAFISVRLSRDTYYGGSGTIGIDGYEEEK